MLNLEFAHLEKECGVAAEELRREVEEKMISLHVHA